MDGRKKPKTQAWYDAMYARRGAGTNQYTFARQLGLPDPVMSEKTRNLKSSITSLQRHSDTTKEKIRQKRIKFLTDNPEKVPYRLNHYSQGQSYPEKYWKGILDKHNVEYIEQYPIGRYQLDFAIVKHKIDLEIDGDQHYLDPRIAEGDKRRNRYLEELGWKIIRIKWSDYKKLVDKEQFVNYILFQLDGPITQ